VNFNVNFNVLLSKYSASVGESRQNQTQPVSKSELCEVKIVRNCMQNCGTPGRQTVTNTCASKGSAQSTLCVVSNKKAINTKCNAHSTADKIHLWQPQCRTQHEL
jgi:recombinational DNA repair protein RecR